VAGGLVPQWTDLGVPFILRALVLVVSEALSRHLAYLDRGAPA